MLLQTLRPTQAVYAPLYCMQDYQAATNAVCFRKQLIHNKICAGLTHIDKTVTMLLALLHDTESGSLPADRTTVYLLLQVCWRMVKSV